MQKGSVNKVVLVGHLGGDPEVRHIPSGVAVANLLFLNMLVKKIQPNIHLLWVLQAALAGRSIILNI